MTAVKLTDVVFSNGFDTVDFLSLPYTKIFGYAQTAESEYFFIVELQDENGNNTTNVEQAICATLLRSDNSIAALDLLQISKGCASVQFENQVLQ